MISANSSLYSQHNFDRESNSDNQQIIEFIKTLKDNSSPDLNLYNKFCAQVLPIIEASPEKNYKFIHTLFNIYQENIQYHYIINQIIKEIIFSNLISSESFTQYAKKDLWQWFFIEENNLSQLNSKHFENHLYQLLDSSEQELIKYKVLKEFDRPHNICTKLSYLKSLLSENIFFNHPSIATIIFGFLNSMPYGDAVKMLMLLLNDHRTYNSHLYNGYLQLLFEIYHDRPKVFLKSIEYSNLGTIIELLIKRHDREEQNALLEIIASLTHLTNIQTFSTSTKTTFIKYIIDNSKNIEEKNAQQLFITFIQSKFHFEIQDALFKSCFKNKLPQTLQLHITKSWQCLSYNLQRELASIIKITPENNLSATKNKFLEFIENNVGFTPNVSRLSLYDLDQVIEHLNLHRKNKGSFTATRYQDSNVNCDQTHNLLALDIEKIAISAIPTAYFFAGNIDNDNISNGLNHIEVVIKIHNIYISLYGGPYDKFPDIKEHMTSTQIYRTNLELLNIDSLEKVPAPQADMVSCGALAYTQAKKLLQNKNDALRHWSLCLEIPTNNGKENMFFVPPPHILKISQSTQYIIAIQGALQKIAVLLEQSMVIHYVDLSDKNQGIRKILTVGYFQEFHKKWLEQLAKIANSRNMMIIGAQNKSLDYKRWQIKNHWHE